ncbi:MAG: hypothetical protein HEQ38_06150 [Gemmatimonas sp.]|nr:hypothetical protein [Gemmatimonas sp.]
MAWVLWNTLFDGRTPAFLPTTAERTLYFKLPLEGVRFHWEFLEPSAFLAGELTLRIINTNRDDTLVIFHDGKISDGWQMIGTNTRDSSFYFGFSTDRRYVTAADDSLIITLRAPKDLRGHGVYKEGTLPAGTWQSQGTYSSIYGGRWNPLDFLVRAGDPPMAFMECWDTVWPIRVTRNTGWGGLKPANEDSGVFSRIKTQGVDGRVCGSSNQTD